MGVMELVSWFWLVCSLLLTLFWHFGIFFASELWNFEASEFQNFRISEF
jgi:hypothetical protein